MAKILLRTVHYSRFVALTDPLCIAPLGQLQTSFLKSSNIYLKLVLKLPTIRYSPLLLDDHSNTQLAAVTQIVAEAILIASNETVSGKNPKNRKKV